MKGSKCIYYSQEIPSTFTDSIIRIICAIFVVGREEREAELAGTGVCACVERDEASIAEEFHNIVLPFVRKHGQYFT